MPFLALSLEDDTSSNVAINMSFVHIISEIIFKNNCPIHQSPPKKNVDTLQEKNIPNVGLLMLRTYVMVMQFLLK